MPEIDSFSRGADLGLKTIDVAVSKIPLKNNRYRPNERQTSQNLQIDPSKQNLPSLTILKPQQY